MYILIEGKHPLYDSQNDNEQTFLEKLNKPKWKMSSKFSTLAKDFFYKLCNTMPIERYTSDKALMHPWITRDFNSAIPLTQSEQIREFQTESLFRNALNITYFLSVSKIGGNRNIRSAEESSNSSIDLKEYLAKCKRVVKDQISESSKETAPGTNPGDSPIRYDDLIDPTNDDGIPRKTFSFDLKPEDIIKFLPD